MSPFNPQIAQGTGQQFTLKSLSAGGHLRDRTDHATWSVAREGGAPLPGPAGGLLELAEPGRYQVTAAYGEHTVTTGVTVTTATLTGLAIGPSAPSDLVGSGVADIDGTGTATGDSIGTAQVSADYVSG